MGVHRLEERSFLHYAQGNRVLVEHPKDFYRNRASRGGLVAIIEMSKEKMTGCIFGLALYEASGALRTDYYPFSTFHLPVAD